MTSHQYLKSNILLKIRFPNSLTQGYWAIEEKQTKTIYAVPVEGIIMAILCIEPLTKPKLFEWTLAKINTPTTQLESILEYLISKKIIFLVNQPTQPDTYFNSAISWISAGWDMAAHYHFFTCQAPYLDYSSVEDTLQHVRDKMEAYHLEEPDVSRCKRYANNLGIQSLPPMEDILQVYGFPT